MASTFQIKSWVSIVAGMLNHVRGVAVGITDFNVGGVARTMLEAPAIEIEECYQQAFNGLRAAIPVATYESFNFARLAAAPASGLVTVTVAVTAQDVTIPAGTLFSSIASRVGYLSQEVVTIPAGSATGVVSVVGVSPGVAGNLPAASAFAVTPQISNFFSAANALLFNNGRDLESDDERKQRFVDYVRTLQRCSNDALIYGAKTTALFNASGIETERVKSVSVVEPYVADVAQPIAWSKVYIHNGAGSTSTQIKDEVVRVLHGYVNDAGVKVPGWKASGVKVDVLIATEVPVNVTGVITPEPGYVGADLAAAAEDVIGKHLLGLDNGETSKYKDRVILVSAIPGVANIVYSTPTVDVTATPIQKLMPGTLTITSA